MKDFITEIIEMLHMPSLQDSFIEHTSKPVILSEFEERFKSYEIRIKELMTDLTNNQIEVTEKNKAMDNLVNENNNLKKEVNKLKIYLSELKDEQNMLVREKEQNLKKTFDSQKRELGNNLEIAQKHLIELEEKNVEYYESIEQLKIQLKKMEDINLNISQNYVHKKQFESLLQEKSLLEKKTFELENTIFAQTSEIESFKNNIKNLKQNIDRTICDKENKFKGEIQDLEDELRKKSKTIAQYELESKGNTEMGIKRKSTHKLDDFYTDNMFSYRFLNIDESMFTKEINENTQDTQINPNILEKFEELQDKFEQHRAESSNENVILSRRIKELTSEVNKLKMQNKMISEEKLSIQKSARDFNSREISIVKKNAEMPTEFVDRLVKLDQSNKQLRNENKHLKSKIIKDSSAFHLQLDVLYSVVSCNYVRNF